jgi:hypothetical protein
MVCAIAAISVMRQRGVDRGGRLDQVTDDLALGLLGSLPLARARLTASAAITASWQVNALVEATPISGPAWVESSRSTSRAIELVGTLMMPRW